MTSDIRIPLPRAMGAADLSMEELQAALAKYVRMPELGHSRPVVLDIAVYQDGEHMVVFSNLVDASSNIVESGTAHRVDRRLASPAGWPKLADELAAEIAGALP